MTNSVRPRSTRRAYAGLYYATSTIPRPNPVVFAWRWRYELGLAVGLTAAVITLNTELGTARAVWALVTAAVLVGALALWPAARHQLVARAWCVITPHRVRTGCAQAWIHSRYGKIPVVFLTTREPFGERVRLWCRAGTSAEDFIAVRHQLAAACWAKDIRVRRHQRYSQVVMLDVIRRMPSMPGFAEGAPLDVETSSAGMPEGSLDGNAESPRILRP
jgi:hypothetical protein